MKPVIIIPARLYSTRLQNKPLAKVNDSQTLLERTYERAFQVSPYAYIASSDKQVLQFCSDAKIPSIETGTYENGTQRAYAAAEYLELAQDRTIINWQVDEPEIRLFDIESLLFHHAVDPFPIRTLVAPLKPEHAYDQNAVKVAYSGRRCHWFSRNYVAGSKYHVGIYCFRVCVLKTIAALKTTELSDLCRLEQLTWIQANFSVMGTPIRETPISINTEEDLEKYRKWLEETQRENAEPTPAVAP